MTPLHLAAESGSLAVVHLLLGAGADTEIASRDCSWTALHLAAFNGRPLAAKVLMEAGADPGARDRDGLTALELASSKRRGLVSLILGWRWLQGRILVALETRSLPWAEPVAPGEPAAAPTVEDQERQIAQGYC
jgi:hypothetical protein